jgi:hypothetical protein
VSESKLNQSEVTLLDHTLQAGDLGALTYFWITGSPAVAYAQIRIYIDGETNPSLAYQPAKASGVGIGAIGQIIGPGNGSTLGPWSTKWFGQLGRSAYFNTFRVPFQRSLRLTYQSGLGQPDAMLFIQARGVSGLGDGLSDIIPGFTLPPTARLTLQVRDDTTYAPLEYMTLADVPTGSGALFATTMWWHSQSKSTIEGCVRAYMPRNQSFSESMLLSTGWEDYYITSWGMIQGAFQGELSGTTHWTSPGNLNVSAYRFHTQDPLFFEDGLRVVLRNGETKGPAGKCLQETGGRPVGTPGSTTLGVYAWVYSW